MVKNSIVQFYFQLLYKFSEQNVERKSTFHWLKQLLLSNGDFYLYIIEKRIIRPNKPTKAHVPEVIEQGINTILFTLF